MSESENMQRTLRHRILMKRFPWLFSVFKDIAYAHLTETLSGTDQMCDIAAKYLKIDDAPETRWPDLSKEWEVKLNTDEWVTASDYIALATKDQEE